jgi:hypothetical protein
MRGIPLEGQGPRLHANIALVAAFLVSRGETVPDRRSLLEIAMDNDACRQ